MVALGQDSHRFVIGELASDNDATHTATDGVASDTSRGAIHISISSAITGAANGAISAETKSAADDTTHAATDGVADGVASDATSINTSDSSEKSKPLVLGGVVFEGSCPALDGNSDSDVVLHALCNAISGITTVNILGSTADKMCFEEGIKDSSLYVLEALKYLDNKRISHISFSIECRRPIISPMIPEMRRRISEITGVPSSSIGITATSGNGLSDFGKGLGIQALCIVTTEP